MASEEERVLVPMPPKRRYEVRIRGVVMARTPQEAAAIFRIATGHSAIMADDTMCENFSSDVRVV